jgi:hypothetical protein
MVKALLRQEEFPFPFEEETHHPSWLWASTIELYSQVWRFAWSHQNERCYLEQMQHLLEVARAAVVKKSLADVQPAFARLEEESTSKNWYDRLRCPSLLVVPQISHHVKKAMRAETERSLTLCAVALKRYSLRYGKMPASLDSLVPEFLSSVPIDYMDGKPVKYHLNADGSFTLYSVGEDGKDDGGDTAMSRRMTRRRNLWEERDFVWPSPALPDEIEAYREEARKN